MRKIIFTITAFVACVSLQASADNDFAVSPDQAVAGTAQAKWSQHWWQWAGSFNANESPVADRTGADCWRKQSGPVWFLAGTYGTQRTIRTCRVPRNKYLFFPLINYVVMPHRQPKSGCSSVTQTAKAMTDNPSLLLLDLDGQRLDGLDKYRQATEGCFDMGELAEPRYRVFPSAANGYYVMLKPLSPGRHELNFGGALPNMLQAVTYTLIVE